MKKYITYIGILTVGFLFGWLIFSNPESAHINEHSNTNSSINQTKWTCAMHPQIMLPEQGDCPICGMDLIPAESNSEGLDANEIKMTKNAMALANIQTSIVGNNKSNKSANVILLSGKISENKDKTATMPAHFDGRIEKIYVNSLGEQVKKGQLIAEVYSPFLVTAQQELIIASKNKESQPKLYLAVRKKFENLNIHGSILDKIENTGKVIPSFPIYSHVNGVITEISVNVGAHIMDGMPIFKVSNLNTVWAEFDVYENQISQFKKGQSLKVTTTAYADEVFDAVISFINPILNQETRTVTIRATLKNKNRILKPGMFVSGKITDPSLKTLTEVITVPASAVLWTGKRSLVYIKTNPNEAVFEMREVTLGNKSGETYQITSGLENGDEIVTNGTFTVDAAAQLQGKKSMMNKKEKESTLDTSMKMKLPIDFQQQFSGVLKAYFKLKDAFIASESLSIITSAEASYKVLKEIPINELTKTEKTPIIKSLGLLKSIASSKNLVKQRADFILLNENIMALTMNLDAPEQKIYIQKCPMADSNKGAVWLSKEKEILNPYFGHAMLKCGSVIKTIQ